jgi:uncharacterized protein
MTDRIRLIDALRGLSLAGIAVAHFGEQYLGFMPPPGQPYNVHGTADGVLEALSWIFVRGKGFGIFSFLFGLSFALQMQRAERRLTIPMGLAVFALQVEPFRARVAGPA